MATPSPEEGISVEIDRLIPPAPPANVEAYLEANELFVSWQGTGTDVDQYYQVYRRGMNAECWEIIGIQTVIEDNKGGYIFNAPMIENPENFRFAVTTVDIYGNESNLSQVIELDK